MPHSICHRNANFLLLWHNEPPKFHAPNAKCKQLHINKNQKLTRTGKFGGIQLVSNQFQILIEMHVCIFDKYQNVILQLHKKTSGVFSQLDNFSQTENSYVSTQSPKFQQNWRRSIYHTPRVDDRQTDGRRKERRQEVHMCAYMCMRLYKIEVRKILRFKVRNTLTHKSNKH